MSRGKLLILGLGLIIGLVSIIYTNLMRGKKLRAAMRKRIDLRDRGIRIQVAFDDCEVKSRSDVLQVPAEGIPSRIEMLDSLAGHDSGNEGVEMTVSVIKYKYATGGEEISFLSEPISSSRESLLLKLDQKKSTYIYFDPNDYSSYYFDLEFLNES